LFPFEKLANLAKIVERHTFTKNVPLILSGWSTGGLIAVRILQKYGLDRKISGSLLFTPAVSVPLLIGEFGVVTVRTLTSNQNPPYRGPLKPSSPALHPIFAGILLVNSRIAFAEFLPKGIPTMVILAGDTLDKYVKTLEVKLWTENQRKHGVNIKGIQFGNSLHDTDNEREEIGKEVRRVATEFVVSIFNKNAPKLSRILKQGQEF
jgi:hypothetical protein